MVELLEPLNFNFLVQIQVGLHRGYGISENYGRYNNTAVAIMEGGYLVKIDGHILSIFNKT